MAKFKKPAGPRKRLTFYLTDVQAKRLVALQSEAAQISLRLTFSDDFSIWMNHQLSLAEKQVKSIRKEHGKGGKDA